ncbi:hypothetical protein SeMB42_g02011 [Synchytrium endobioticum]|uniref:RIIa domain-containing protein n=1 Tax=Synchytrium endobioticum TaxID=286115 RepID=A0A507DB25_9FUNG|nr:hypothetical protein SeLEV6574_g02308 [Synchytrium endobioticum]TPX51147.1 hypothetical protein SeMB42_g02011 [Synchytrium endobioticum]
MSDQTMRESTTNLVADPAKAPFTVEKTIELESEHQQRKAYISAQQERYMEANAEIKQILSDFLVQVVHHQPTDVYEFARNHFGKSAPLP